MIILCADESIFILFVKVFLYMSPIGFPGLPCLLHCYVVNIFINGKISPYLNGRMEKSHSVEHGFPLREVADVQLILIDP